MNLSGSADEAREISRVLIRALGWVVSRQGDAEGVALAREVAQMLGLEGLDRALHTVAPHAGAPWPATLEPLLQRLARLCAATEEAGSIAPFERADVELAGLAAEHEALEWAPVAFDAPASDPLVPTLLLGEVIEDLASLAGEDLRILQRVRLATPVAAALRAALDWLHGESGARRPLRASAEDSMFEVWVTDIDPMGLRAASEVLAAVDGNLGPVGGAAPPGTWRVRVPSHTARATFLMVVQGGLPLALPWHSVLHVHLMPEREIPEAHPPAAVLAPLASLNESSEERPVVMLAHGLRRAWLVADRLVWRFPAEPCAPSGEAPAPGLRGMVRTEEGESWWRVDVARLLAGVEPLPVPEGARPARREAPMDPNAMAEAVERALAVMRAEGALRHVPAAPVAPAPVTPRPIPPPHANEPPRVEVVSPALRATPPAPRSTPPSSRPVLRLLDRSEVESLSVPAPEVVVPAAPGVPPMLDRADVEAVATPTPVTPTPATPPPQPAPPRGAVAPTAPAAPAVPARRPRRALVAEDSIMARVFLVRMLEQRGFVVDAVDNAVALARALTRGPWGVVLVDVELPDARGAALVAGVRETLEHAASPAVVVALVRDAADIAAARKASVGWTLHKPFSEGALDALFGRLGLARAH